MLPVNPETATFLKKTFTITIEMVAIYVRNNRV